MECVGGHGDIPDGAARAFVDASGRVQLFAPNDTTYRNIGDNLVAATRDCSAPVLLSDLDANARNYNDFEWLFSPYTLDGSTVVALVHNEYHGWCHGNCPFTPAPFNPRCAWAAITEVVSRDSGARYQHAAAPPAHVVASLPMDYSPVDYDSDLQAFPGYRGPTNIIRGPDGLFYFLVNAFTGTSMGGVYGRTCLVRTDEAGLAVPASWRAFDGEGFTQTLDRQLCAGLAVGGTQWSYNTYLQRYLAVGFAVDGFGMFISASPGNLTRWQSQQPLMATRLPWQAGSGGWKSYPSLLQPGDPTRNFERTGRSPYLYYVTQSATMTGLPRDLRRRRIRFSLPGDAGRYDVLSLDMNERRGIRTLDSSFYGSDALLEGGVQWITSAPTGPSALRFTGGVTDQLRVPAATNLDIVGDLTIEAFLRIDHLSADDTGFARIVRKSSGAPSGSNYSLTVPPAHNPCAGRLFFAFSAAGAPVGACATRRVDDGQWHHVAVTYAATAREVRYYVDGLLDSSVAVAASPGEGVNRAPVIVGNRLSGALDAVHIYNYARTETEIALDSRGHGSVELCNGFDDDANGLVDDGWPCERGTVESTRCADGSMSSMRSCEADCAWGAWSACADAGPPRDAGDVRDAGHTAADGGVRDTGRTVADAGSPPMDVPTGCGCLLAPAGAPPRLWIVALLLLSWLRGSPRDQ